MLVTMRADAWLNRESGDGDLFTPFPEQGLIAKPGNSTGPNIFLGDHMNMLDAMESIAPGHLASVNQAIKLLVQDGIDQLVAIETALSRYHRGSVTTEGMACTGETYDMLKGFCK